MTAPESTPEPLLSAAVVRLTCLNFLFFSVYLLYFPTLPFFIERLGGAKSEIGLLIGMSSLASLVARPFVGYAVDAYGRRPVMLTGLAVFVLNALLYNVVQSVASVAVLRLLTGASMAIFVTSASASIADVAAPSRRGEVMSYYGLANSLAFAIGPALGGFIIHAGWLTGFDDALTSRMGWLSGAETGDLHFTSLFLFSAAVGVLALGIAALGGETRPTGVGAGRKLDLGNLFSRAGVFPASINFASSFVMASMVTFMPLFARDHGLENAGSVFMVYAGMVIMMRLSLGRYMDRYPRSWFIVPGIASLSLSMIVMATASHPAQMFVAAAFFGAGAGSFQPAMMALLVDRCAPTERGRALSTFTLGNDLGLSMGALLLGVVVEHAGFRAAFSVSATMAGLGALLFVIATQRAHGWRQPVVARA
ncbi:MAG: MFS transporter [Dehalococcoidia bacterium]|nr:MFS transporter [Dehalococcoidia bacterium]